MGGPLLSGPFFYPRGWELEKLLEGYLVRGGPSR